MGAIEERLQLTALLASAPQALGQWRAQLLQLPDLQRLLPHAEQALRCLRDLGQWEEEGAGDEDDDEETPSWVVAAREASAVQLHALLAGLLDALEALHALRQALAAASPSASRLPLLQQVTASAEEVVLPLLERLLALFPNPDQVRAEHMRKVARRSRGRGERRGAP